MNKVIEPLDQAEKTAVTITKKKWATPNFYLIDYDSVNANKHKIKIKESTGQYVYGTFNGKPVKNFVATNNTDTNLTYDHIVNANVSSFIS